MSNQENFRVSGKITKLLGRESVADPVTALFEVIKNSHDADVLLVSIKFQDFEKGFGKIIIKETKGDGMTYNDIKNKFLVIGTYSKDSKMLKNRITNRLKRTMLGQKGVGRFALEKLGEEVKITSKPHDSFQLHDFKINWKKFESEKITVDQIPIKIKTSQREDKEDSGLEITISKVRDNWNADKVKKLIEYLKGFVLPREIQIPNSFNIEIDAESLGIKKHLIEQELSETAFYSLSARLEKGKITYTAEKMGKSYIREKTITTFRSHLTRKERKVSELECGQVKLYIYYFPIFRKNDVLHEHYYDKAAEYYGDEFYSQIKKSMKDQAGVRIYRGGLREFKYGNPGFDWTDRGSISRAYAGTMQEDKIVGFCILGKKNDKIIATTNRTEAIENQAFTDLKDFVISTMKKLDLKISEDRDTLFNEFKEEQKRLEEKLKQAEAKYSKTKTTSKDPEVLSDFSKAIRIIEKRNRDDESNVTISEIEYAHVALGHFISKLYHDFVGPSTDLFESSIAKLDSHAKGIKPKTSEELEKIIGRLGKKWKQIKVIFDALENIEYGMGVENYYKREKVILEPKKELDYIFEDLTLITNTQDIIFRNKIDSKLEIWTYGPIFYSVMYNLMSNAIKALRRQKDKKNKKNTILVTTQEEGRWLNFIFADNSSNPIRKDRRNTVFEPWISTTSGIKEFKGKGIGLSICKEILKFARGQIEVIEPILDKGTTFVVRFPRGIMESS